MSQAADTVKRRATVAGSSPNAQRGINRILLWIFGLLCVAALLDFGPWLGLSDSMDAIATVVVGFAFVLVHGSAALGWRNLIAFIVITVGVSFTAEAAGVATGLVFGDYHYTDALGPRILGVPPAVQAAYVAVGYASFMMARIVLGQFGRARNGALLTVPLVGAFFMVAWDVAMDPFQSTVAGDWIWEKGGPYFGVGIHNYVGWFATVLLFMLTYQLCTTRWAESPRRPLTHSRVFWSQPVLYYAVIAFGVFLAPVVGGLPDPIASPENYSGTTEALARSLSLVTVFVMGTPVVVALTRLFSRPPSEVPA